MFICKQMLINDRAYILLANISVHNAFGVDQYDWTRIAPPYTSCAGQQKSSPKPLLLKLLSKLSH